MKPFSIFHFLKCESMSSCRQRQRVLTAKRSISQQRHRRRVRLQQGRLAAMKELTRRNGLWLRLK